MDETQQMRVAASQNGNGEPPVMTPEEIDAEWRAAMIAVGGFIVGLAIVKLGIHLGMRRALKK